jgi:hypothetical protein
MIGAGASTDGDGAVITVVGAGSGFSVTLSPHPVSARAIIIGSESIKAVFFIIFLKVEFKLSNVSVQII